MLVVFKVLGGDERIKVGAVFAFEGDDFAAGTAHVGVDVECLPEM
jgi:hypothetical protein